MYLLQEVLQLAAGAPCQWLSLRHALLIGPFVGLRDTVLCFLQMPNERHVNGT
jgi:hypothetical protein